MDQSDLAVRIHYHDDCSASLWTQAPASKGTVQIDRESPEIVCKVARLLRTPFETWPDGDAWGELHEVAEGILRGLGVDLPDDGAPWVPDMDDRHYAQTKGLLP